MIKHNEDKIIPILTSNGVFTCGALEANLKDVLHDLITEEDINIWNDVITKRILGYMDDKPTKL